MHLWQLDLVGGVFLADGRECKILTAIDDHSRFVVAATVLERPTGGAVVEAFTAAIRHYGVPFEGSRTTASSSPAGSPVLSPPRCCSSGRAASMESPTG